MTRRRRRPDDESHAFHELPPKVPTILVCIRVEDKPHPTIPSDILVCGRCLASVWRSRAGRWWTGSILCLRCAVADPHDDDEFRPAPWVRDDLVGNGDIAREGNRIIRRDMMN